MINYSQAPQCLISVMDDIKKTDEIAPGIYYFNTVKNKLSNHNDALTALNSLDAKYQGTLWTKDIIDVATHTNTADWQSILELFLAMMLWGWQKQGMGIDNIVSGLNDKEHKDILTESLIYVKQGQIEKAYTRFKLKGCGPAYFTKYFYFIGKAYKLEPLPLILDSQVANYLEFICQEEGWDKSEFFDIGGRDAYGAISSVKRNVKGYLNYIEAVHEWANSNHCDPDKFEMYFYYNARLIKSEVRRSMPSPSLRSNPRIPNPLSSRPRSGTNSASGTGRFTPGQIHAIQMQLATDTGHAINPDKCILEATPGGTGFHYRIDKRHPHSQKTIIGWPSSRKGGLYVGVTADSLVKGDPNLGLLNWKADANHGRPEVQGITSTIGDPIYQQILYALAEAAKAL